MGEQKVFDVIIIGGSYAGLSAAMVLGRSLRDTLVIDSGEPCNRQTPHSHNFLTQDGKTPREISTIANQQVAQYKTVRFVNGMAISGKRTDQGFEITTKAGETFMGKKLILATGVKDLIPDIEGFAACWGISVIHCPYCHGYENKHNRTGIMTNGEHAEHFVPLVYNLTKEIVLFTSGKADLSEIFLSKLKKYSIEIIETEVSKINHQDGHLSSVTMQDGREIQLDALYAKIPFVQHTDIPSTLGCEFDEQGFIKVDGFNKTNIEGVFACGDNTTLFRSVAQAVASGNKAGAVINKELADEEF